MSDKNCHTCEFREVDDNEIPCIGCHALDAWVEASCDTCRHEHLNCCDDPCRYCCVGEDSNWEAKDKVEDDAESETYCENCKHEQVDISDNPCRNCDVDTNSCWEAKDDLEDGLDDALEDAVNSPSHYTQGNIEVIDFIMDQKLDYSEGNVVKYICRYKIKGNPIEDLMKARKYIDYLLQREEMDG